MKKILKFGLGIVAGAAVAHAAYHGYKNMEEEMIHELTDRVRQHFSTKKLMLFGFLMSQLLVPFLKGELSVMINLLLLKSMPKL